MDISSTSMMQQTQMRTGASQGNGQGRMMRETISMLPQDVQVDIQALMQTLDPAAKQDAMGQMAQIESSNMTVEDLTAAIMDIFNPQAKEEKSSFPGSFSAYA